MGEERTKYWFPAFKLISNPFQFFEASREEYVDGIPYIETEMHRRVKAFIKSEISCIIKGTRGCGKSMLIQGLQYGEEEFFPVVTPKSVDDVYHQIFEYIDIEIEEKYVKMFWGPHAERAIENWERCKLCPIHCRISTRGRNGPSLDLTIHLRSTYNPCKARKIITQKILRDSMDVCDRLFLMDVPDNLKGKEIKDFVSLCNLLLDSPNSLIIFATPEQASLLRKTDTFLRFPVVDFELPEKAFFKELFKQRINLLGRQNENTDAPFPFKDEVVKRIVELSNFNARDFIQICNYVLTEMWMRGSTEPCDLDFLDKLNLGDIEKRGPSEKERVFQLLESYKGEWVKLEQLCRDMQNDLGIRFTERKVTSFLKKLGFTLRRVKDGKTQAFITPSLLKTLQKTKSNKSI